MRKTLILLLGLVSAFSLAADQQKIYRGYVTVAFGHVRQADGTMRDISGMKLPMTIEPIDAKAIKKIKRSELNYKVPAVTARAPRAADPFEGLYASLATYRPVPPVLASTVYSCDTGVYGIIDGDDPSSLDDIVMSGGANQPWQNLTFGIDFGAVHTFLIRWICYRNYTEGLGHDAMAFSNWFADFGVIFPSNQIPATGTHKVTISVAAAGVTAPDDTMFMAQQFRTPQPDGNGPFDTSMNNVYNTSGPPTIGNSDNVIWYDWDPLNGIYAEDEIDNFGEGTQANHLRTITVSGTTDTLVPFSAVLESGVFNAGELPDLWVSDDSYYMATQILAPVRLTVTGLSPTATVTSLKFSCDAHTAKAIGVRRIKLWNYQTSQYDLVDTRSNTTTDQVAEITITNNPSKYVNASNRQVKAQVEFDVLFSAGTVRWAVFMDRTNWVVTHP